MPGLTIPYAPRHLDPPPTNEPLEFADLAIVDLSKANTEQGRAELVQQVREAMTTNGFFYVINHGYTQAQRDRMFDVADLAFTHVSAAEKQRYASKDDTRYDGYKLRQFWRIEPGVFDQIEHYNMHRDIHHDPHPEALRPFIPELEDFNKHTHYNILFPILRLLALGLEIPEETFVEQNKFEDEGFSSMRFMKYFTRSQEEEDMSKNVWLKGHTDEGGVTILWSQPVGGLQILSPDGKWRWIKHIDNAVVVNIGDAMEFISGGYYKATIHRVIQPPIDQRSVPRLGIFYFSMPSDHVKLAPVQGSPVLERVGIRRLCPDEVAPSMEAWRKERTLKYGKSELTKSADGSIESEVIQGVTVNHYN